MQDTTVMEIILLVALIWICILPKIIAEWRWYYDKHRYDRYNNDSRYDQFDAIAKGTTYRNRKMAEYTYGKRDYLKD